MTEYLEEMLGYGDLLILATWEQGFSVEVGRYDAGDFSAFWAGYGATLDVAIVDCLDKMTKPQRGL